MRRPLQKIPTWHESHDLPRLVWACVPLPHLCQGPPGAVGSMGGFLGLGVAVCFLRMAAAHSVQ